MFTIQYLPAVAGVLSLLVLGLQIANFWSRTKPAGSVSEAIHESDLGLDFGSSLRVRRALQFLRLLLCVALSGLSAALMSIGSAESVDRCLLVFFVSQQRH